MRRTASNPLTPEVEEFLATHTRAFLFTLRKDGAPTVHPLTGHYHEGALVFNSYRKSAKVRNFERDNRAACVVITDDAETTFRALLVKGRVEILPVGTPFPPRPPEEIQAATRFTDLSASAARRTQDRLQSGKRIVFRLVPASARFLG